MSSSRAGASFVIASVSCLVVAVAGALLAGTAPAGAGTGDPAYSVPEDDLAAALDCPDTFAGTHDPVLLVHGTFTSGHEQWDWNYNILLPGEGFDVCLVTYPDRGLGDMQISAEYVAFAVQEIHRRTGRRVDMMGHSQGGLMPRWAIKWWPSVRAALDDFVLVASPNHGTSLASGAKNSPRPLIAVGYQFEPGSNFLTALNKGDETPGAIEYTNIWSDNEDELVQPDESVPGRAGTARFLGDADPAVADISVQALCPLRVVDHVSIGLTDVVVQRLVIDAFTGDGPADAGRAGIDPVACNASDQYVVPEQFPALVGQFQSSFEDGSPEFAEVDEEPPLRCYATPAGCGSEPAGQAPTATDPSSAGVEAGAEVDVDEAGARSLPPTGGTGPLYVALATLAATITCRRRFMLPRR